VAGFVFNNEALAQVGRMRYSIFLIHTFTELLLPHVGVMGRIMDSNYRCLVLIPASVALANLSWHWIERPIMEMRRRLPRPTLPELTPSPAAVAAVAAEP
jgi:peptidoglycan/LPS O-acetylase OafA/YrhL